jgi:predicted DCC family thiol-disulfide oxidoreductase YuxK
LGLGAPDLPTHHPIAIGHSHVLRLVVRISDNPLMHLDHTSPEGWVLYDDSCGFCRRWVPFWAPTLRRHGYNIAPLQAPWVREKLNLSESLLIEDLRLLLSDGRVIQGADGYRHLMRRLWWTYPFYLLSTAPGFRKIFNRCYRIFARNRFRFSKACGLAGCSQQSSDSRGAP